MSFELHGKKPLQKELRKLLRNQIEDAIEEIDVRSEAALDHVIHELRKRLKRIRAVLRLVQGEVRHRDFTTENRFFRDIARPFTELRDARVLLDTLDELKHHFDSDLTDDSFRDVRIHFEDQLRTVCNRIVDQEHAFPTARERLAAAVKRVKQWLHATDHWSTLEDGYHRTYSRARNAFRRAMEFPEPVRRHEWRKQVKYLGYQIELLRPTWPERLSEIWQALDQMGKLLGQDHDLAVMRENLLQRQQDGGTLQDTGSLLSLIDKRQRQLQHDATEIGQRFFQERPKSFVNRLNRCRKLGEIDHQKHADT